MKFWTIFCFSVFLLFCRSNPPKSGFVDLKGNWVIPPNFDHAEDFSEGYAVVKEQDKWYFIDPQGKRLPGSYEFQVGNFQNGLALSRLSHYSYGYVDKSGTLKFPTHFKYAFDFKDGYALVAEDWIPKTGGALHPNYYFYYINTKGEKLVSFPKLAMAHEVQDLYVNDGFFPVNCGKEGWGFMDQNGKFKIPCSFDRVSSFSEGMAVVGQKETEDSKFSYGYVNGKGDLSIPYKYTYAGSFRNGLALVSEVSKEGDTLGKFYYINKLGVQAIPETFSYAKDFSEGFAFVSYTVMENGYETSYNKFIDPAGRDIFKLGGSMGYACNFKNGFAGVNLFIPLKEEDIKEDMDFSKMGTSYGVFIDLKGKQASVKFPDQSFANWQQGTHLSCAISGGLVRKKVFSKK
ncbi:WG repeat-containing protein [Leptospira sp. 'Mane']|uniref:WG repeat-containing protein n=1 Tax=Leptospira sp. 'Mane' TaxID=3387407 RepID=UPI00398BABFA